MPKDCIGITLNRWGPAAWNTLHSFAHTSPEKFEKAEREEWAVFLRGFAKRLPCPNCKAHFEEYLDANLPSATLEGRKDIVRFLNDAHNAVNARLGKRIVSEEEHDYMYSLAREWHVLAMNRATTVCVVAIVVSALGVLTAKRDCLRDYACGRERV